MIRQWVAGLACLAIACLALAAAPHPMVAGKASAEVAVPSATDLPAGTGERCQAAKCPMLLPAAGSPIGGGSHASGRAYESQPDDRAPSGRRAGDDPPPPRRAPMQT